MVTLGDIIEQRERVHALYAEASRMNKRAAVAQERLKKLHYEYDRTKAEGQDEDADEEP